MEIDIERVEKALKFLLKTKNNKREIEKDIKNMHVGGF